jgi:anti-sigma B factor antagonist
MPANDLITTSVEHHQGVVVLAVGGDIDTNTAPILHTAISQALADKPPALVIDLSGVQIIASAGLRVLLQTKDKVGGSADLAVVSSGGAISKVIRLAGLDATFVLYKTVDDALASVSTNLESRG